MNRFNIGIDGPSGAGKSTVAKGLAKALNIVYVDTGAMYRALGYYCYQNQIDPAEPNIHELVKETQVSIQYIDNTQHVFLFEEDVTQVIRTELIGKYASTISTNPEVRKRMVQMQQQLAATTSVVMDGRDICQVVLPNAEFKFFVTASSLERAKRRVSELEKKGIHAELSQVQKEIEDRDYRDMNREASPLVQAEDAILVDTSNMSEVEVINYLLNLVQSTKKV